MSEKHSAPDGSRLDRTAPANRQTPDPKPTAAVSAVGRHLATSLARRRLLVRASAAVGSAAVAQHYVKPSLQSLGVPAALAVSDGDDKDKKDK